MPLLRRTFLAVALALLTPYGDAQAQLPTEPLPPSKVSLDLGIGGGVVQHDAFATANGIQAEAVLAGRLLSRRGASLVVALNGFTRAIGFGHDLECAVDPASPSGCYPRPQLVPQAAFLGGAELQRHGAALRVLAGPIRYFDQEGGLDRTGTHLRLDLAVPASSRIGFVAAGRMSYLGRIRGDAIEIFSMSAGVRLQR